MMDQLLMVGQVKQVLINFTLTTCKFNYHNFSTSVCLHRVLLCVRLWQYRLWFYISLSHVYSSVTINSVLVLVSPISTRITFVGSWILGSHRVHQVQRVQVVQDFNITDSMTPEWTRQSPLSLLIGITVNRTSGQPWPWSYLLHYLSLTTLGVMEVTWRGSRCWTSYVFFLSKTLT